MLQEGRRNTNLITVECLPRFSNIVGTVKHKQSHFR